jgi:ketosteroid isomerase-like protein
MPEESTTPDPAMSQQNLDIVRAVFESRNAGLSFGSVAKYFDPGIELESPFSSIVGPPYRGHAGMEQWRRDVDEQFARWRMTLDDLRAVGNQVIAIGTVNGLGRASGIALQFSSAIVAHFGSDGQITRVRIFSDVNEALKAVGLAE